MTGEHTYTVNQAKLSVIRGDITLQSTDAIVNAANSGLMGGGGVDGAIHRAGGPAILEECKQIVVRQGHLPTGQAVITTAGKMKAKYVIHTVGPIWGGGNMGEAGLLTNAYQNSLELAASRGLSSVSFPSVSTGAYSYPVDSAARVALRTVVNFLRQETSVKEVIFVLFDSRTYETYADTLWDVRGEKG
ncbi:MAG: O-acetyl-ADP-ribose deacetylase [Chloroflexi bacterium RBG_16_56_11]|nr:MAG: O-acetyl-ADP-ribose deacetylase [Chloroflexi bacterium RBG_16_56_11]